MGLKQPITFVTPSATKENPNPQPVAQISAADAPQAKAYLQECEECKIKLVTATKAIELASQRQTLSDEKVKIAENERDTWKTAAKGGSVLHKTLRTLEILGIGALLGYAAHR